MFGLRREAKVHQKYMYYFNSLRVCSLDYIRDLAPGQSPARRENIDCHHSPETIVRSMMGAVFMLRCQMSGTETIHAGKLIRILMVLENLKGN